MQALDVAAPEEHELAAAADAAAADPAEAFLLRKLSRRVTASELIVSGFVTNVRSVQTEARDAPSASTIRTGTKPSFRSTR